MVPDVSVEEITEEAAQAEAAQAVEVILEPTVEPEPEAVLEAVLEPVLEPVFEPVLEPVLEQVLEPVLEPVPEPALELVLEPSIEVALEVVLEPAPEAAGETALEQSQPTPDVPPVDASEASVTAPETNAPDMLSPVPFDVGVIPTLPDLTGVFAVDDDGVVDPSDMAIPGLELHDDTGSIELPMLDGWSSHRIEETIDEEVVGSELTWLAPIDPTEPVAEPDGFASHVESALPASDLVSTLSDLVIEDFEHVADDPNVYVVTGSLAGTPAYGTTFPRSLTPIDVSPIPELDAAIEAGAIAAARADADPSLVLRRPPFRLDPHDFILPGELPPLMADDERVEAEPVSGTLTDESIFGPIDLDNLRGDSVAPSREESDGVSGEAVVIEAEEFVEEAGLERAVVEGAVDATGLIESALVVDAVDSGEAALVDADPLEADPVDETDAIEAERALDLSDAPLYAPSHAPFYAPASASENDEADVTAHSEATTPDEDAAHGEPEATIDLPAVVDEEATEVADSVNQDVLAEVAETVPRAATPTVPIATVAAEAQAAASSRCDELRLAVAAAPHDWHLRRRLAESLFEVGVPDRAFAELQAALSGLSQNGQLPAAAEIADQLVRISPDRIAYHQKRVELAVRLNDQQRLRIAYLDLADSLVRAGDESRAHPVYARVLELDPWDERAREALGAAAPPPPPPATPDEDFVDLAEWLRDDEPASTRMRMREPQVSGDEQADFDSLLRHFKEGVSRSLGEDDYESHYDLGVAYKEMGLLDDAIAEFQKALRSRRHRLPAYEALGQCFVEQSRHSVAATVLTRALHEPGLGDEHRVGVLYLLAYSCEALQRWEEARSYYSRVYATDIHFRDVAARLAALDLIAR